MLELNAQLGQHPSLESQLRASSKVTKRSTRIAFTAEICHIALITLGRTSLAHFKKLFWFVLTRIVKNPFLRVRVNIECMSGWSLGRFNLLKREERWAKVALKGLVIVSTESSLFVAFLQGAHKSICMVLESLAAYC